MRNWNKPRAAALIGVLIIGIAGCLEEGEIRTPGSETPTSSPEKTRIEGLASIDSVFASWENWDADLEKDGYEIRMWFENTKGHLMHFSGIPLNVTVNLYIQYYDIATFDWDEPELLRTWDITITSSEDIIRIPLEGYCESPGGFEPIGFMDLIVHTPEQGDFEGRGHVNLCPWDPSPFYRHEESDEKSRR